MASLCPLQLRNNLRPSLADSCRRSLTDQMTLNARGVGFPESKSRPKSRLPKIPLGLPSRAVRTGFGQHFFLEVRPVPLTQHSASVRGLCLADWYDLHKREVCDVEFSASSQVVALQEPASQKEQRLDVQRKVGWVIKLAAL